MNPIHDRALSDLIRELATSEFPEALNHFLKKIVPVDNLMVIAYHKDHNPEILYRDSFNPAMSSLVDNQYVKAAFMLDPFYQAISNGIQTGIHHLFAFAPDQFKQSTYFKEYYKDTTVIDEIAIFARVNHDTTVTICIGRDTSSKTVFTKNELMLLQQFEATLTALCESYWRLYQPKEGKNVTLSPIKGRLQSRLKSDLDIHLSPRQAEVAILILQGHSSLSISLQLCISKETIKVFRKQLYSKCNISSQAELFSLLMPIISKL